MNDVKKNFIYNVAYQILILIIPLITIPYVSRIMGASGIGVYSYTYSITYYFMIFAMLGVNNYGNRSIAKVRDDNKLLSKTFKEIYSLQLFTSLLMVLLYYLYIVIFNIEYKDIALIQSLYVISCAFDINWFFFGIEKFKLTVTRNTLVKILSLVMILLFVKTSDDIWIYTLILSGSTLLSQLLLWPFLKKYVIREKIEFKNIFNHFKPCLKLFLPVIAVAVYKVMDKTMLGIMSDISEVGFYENAEKIINIPNAIITALGTVMLPRMSNMYANGKEKEGKLIISKSIKFMMFLSFAMVLGLISISQDFTLIFLGNEFEKVGILIIYLSITIIFLSWGNVLRTQFLIPKERDKEYIISAFLGAITNFIANLILIPMYQSIGACIGTIIAELVVVLYQTYKMKDDLPIKEYFLGIIQFFFKALIMFVCIYSLNFINMNSLVRIILQVSFGVLIYMVLNYKYIIGFLRK